jgi:hypothetical protein
MSPGDDGPVVDKGPLVGLADFLKLVGGGPLRAVTGGVVSLALAGYAVTILHEPKAARLLAVLALWCFFAGWFTHRFVSR